MKKWIQKIFVFVLMAGILLGTPLDRVSAAPKGAKKKVTKSAKKQSSGVRFTKSTVKDLGKNFGEVNEKNGGKLKGELLYHGEFEVWMEEMKLTYIFTDYDEDADYELTDDVALNKIAGRIDAMVSGFKKKDKPSSFVKKLKKGLSDVKWEILDGEPTSYYISERYAEIRFKLKKGAKTKYCLQIALDEKDRIHPDSFAWLTYK